MDPDISSDLSSTLLNEFYAESDEHLTHIREALVALEASVGRAQIDSELVERLFRSFHSLKGISAIAGILPAEQLAHRTEDYLRELSRGNTTLTIEGLDLLMNAAQRLEQVVGAHLAHQDLPEVSTLVEQFATVLPRKESEQTPGLERHAESAEESVPNRIEAARGRGLQVWRSGFTPSPELDKRGVHVNSVRARLNAVGEIIRATPHVRPGGGIAFEFVLAMRETPADLASWEMDGIIFAQIESAGGGLEPPSAVGDQTGSHSPFVAPSHIVRVDLGRLDELMRLTGEMVIHRARFEDQIGRIRKGNSAVDVSGLEEVNQNLMRALRELRESIMRVRLVPVAEIFARMPFVVRDLARETGKKVRLSLSGQQTELDKFLVERLKDPLLHLMRNSISHGVETTEERVSKGKPAEATISLSASTIGDSVLIEVADDGRGVDAERVAQRAESLGWDLPEKLDTVALLNLICEPGFSTRDEADRASGRGVGMSVVNKTVRELGGALTLETNPGQGTRFFLRLPLTLAIADALIISSGDQTYAVPQNFVHEIFQLEDDRVQLINRTEMVSYRGGVLPLLRMTAMFGLPPGQRLRAPVLVLSSERGSAGLVVDRIIGQREIVVRSIRDPLVCVPGVAGATELGDGRPVLILDAAALTNGIVRPNLNGSNARPNGKSLL